MILCGTRRKHMMRCRYCSRPATALCAFKMDRLQLKEPLGFGVEEVVESCSAPICGQCDDWGNCRIHRQRGDNPGGIMEKNDGK